MRRGLTGTILWTLLAVGIGVVLFVVKYEVKDLEHRLAGLNAEIHRNQETIHILRAEWSYLNDPTRLRTLAERHLGMKPVTPTQVATLDTLPKDGIPATGVVYAAVSPARISLPPAAAQAPKSTPQAAPVKLAETQPKPRPADGAQTPPNKLQPAKPQPVRPGTGTLAQAPQVKPLAPPVETPAPAPAKGSRSIVIPSPALAQGEGDAR